MWVIKGKKSEWTRRRGRTTFIIGSCRPLRGPVGEWCSSVVVQSGWMKIYGARTTEFQSDGGGGVGGVGGLQRFRVLASRRRRRRMFPLMSGHARYRGVTMSVVVVVVMLVMVVSQCYQLHRVMKTTAVGTASAAAARRSFIPTRNSESTQ